MPFNPTIPSDYPNVYHGMHFVPILKVACKKKNEYHT